MDKYVIINLCTTIPQELLFFWVNSRIVPVKNKIKYILSAMICISIIIACHESGRISVTWRYLGTLFCMTVFIIPFMKEKRLIRAVFTLVNYMIALLGEVFFSIICYVATGMPMIDSLYRVDILIPFRISSYIVYYLMGSALCKILNKNEFEKSTNIYIPVFMAEFLIPLILVYRSTVLRLNIYASFVNFIIYVILAAIFLITYLFLHESEKRESEYYKTRMLSIQMTEQKKREAELTEQIDKAEEIRNNIINGLTHAQSLLAGEKVKDACSYLGGIVDGLWQNSMYSTNKVVDAVVSSKAKICAEKNIDFECELPIADDVSDRGIKNAELCAVFANLLDNGIRACEGVEQALDEHNSDIHIRPFIRLYAKEKGGYLSIRKENSYDENSQVRKKEGILPEHGLGLGIIESLAKEHDGRLKTEINDGVYITRVTLRLN